jgi:hypothetical protein
MNRASLRRSPHPEMAHAWGHGVEAAGDNRHEPDRGRFSGSGTNRAAEVDVAQPALQTESVFQASQVALEAHEVQPQPGYPVRRATARIRSPRSNVQRARSTPPERILPGPTGFPVPWPLVLPPYSSTRIGLSRSSTHSIAGTDESVMNWPGLRREASGAFTPQKVVVEGPGLR